MIYRDEWAKVIIVVKAYDIDVSGTWIRRRKRESYFGWMDSNSDVVLRLTRRGILGLSDNILNSSCSSISLGYRRIGGLVQCSPDQDQAIIRGSGERYVLCSFQVIPCQLILIVMTFRSHTNIQTSTPI